MAKNDQVFMQCPTEDEGLPVSTFKIKEVIAFPLHYHSVLEWVYVYEGTMEIEVNHQKYHLFAGDFISIGSHHIHSFDSKKQQVKYRLIHMDLSAVRTFGLIPYFLTRTIKLKDDGSILNLLNKIDHHFVATNSETAIGLVSKGYELLEIITEQYEFTEDIDQKEIIKEQMFIKKMNAYVYEHFDQGLTLDQVSHAVGYSSHYFSRKFSDYMGMSFKRYLLILQVGRAKDILQTTEAKITTIAYDSGFKSMVSFNRAFKEIVGMTPSQFRSK